MRHVLLSLESPSSLPTASVSSFPSARLSRMASFVATWAQSGRWQRRRHGRHTWTRIPSHRGIHSLLPRARAHVISHRCVPEHLKFRLCMHIDMWMSPLFIPQVLLYPCVATPGRAEEQPRCGQPAARCGLCNDPLNPSSLVCLLYPRTDSSRHVDNLHESPGNKAAQCAEFQNQC